MENTNHKRDDINKLSDANVVTGAISVVVYMYTNVVFLSYWAFLVPASILPFSAIYSFETSPVASNVIKGVLNNMALLGLFIIPHSILARTTVKAKMALPSCMERTFYVAQASIFMHLQMHFWKELDSEYVIWSIPEPYSYAVVAFFASGFLFLFTATFALDHFWLFGLSQGFGVNINKKIGISASDEDDGFVVRWHYSHCAHPIMTGLFIALWVTPRMTPSHLLLAAVSSLWIIFAVKYLEEPQLESIIGKRYSHYVSQVPRYIPSICPISVWPLDASNEKVGGRTKKED